MNREKYFNYINIIKEELVPAFGCTEPIAIALAAANARNYLGEMPEKVLVICSENIYKNVKGVTIPNSNGMKGIEAATILGIIGGNSRKGLEVLNSITNEQINKTKELVNNGFCKSKLINGVDNLFVLVEAYRENRSASVQIEGQHTNIVKVKKDGKTIFKQNETQIEKVQKSKKYLLDVKNIIHFANIVDLSEIEETISRQINFNYKIADEGIKNSYGIEIGRILKKYYDWNDVRVRAKSLAAAGADARMGGCTLPVVINSGSGNQGLTVSIPVIEFAKNKGSSYEILCRSLIVANLIAIHQKSFIGNLSAFCGAVSAATGAACGLTYLYGGHFEEISQAITNTICNIGGILCDGAKPSCAAKIAMCVDAGIMGFLIGKMENKVFSPGDGLVGENVEKTILNIGHIAKNGMKLTDKEIVKIMRD